MAIENYFTNKPNSKNTIFIKTSLKHKNRSFDMKYIGLNRNNVINKDFPILPFNKPKINKIKTEIEELERCNDFQMNTDCTGLEENQIYILKKTIKKTEDISNENKHKEEQNYVFPVIVTSPKYKLDHINTKVKSKQLVFLDYEKVAEKIKKSSKLFKYKNELKDEEFGFESVIEKGMHILFLVCEDLGNFTENCLDFIKVENYVEKEYIKKIGQTIEQKETNKNEFIANLVATSKQWKPYCLLNRENLFLNQLDILKGGSNTKYENKEFVEKIDGLAKDENKTKRKESAKNHKDKKALLVKDNDSSFRKQIEKYMNSKKN